MYKLAYGFSLHSSRTFYERFVCMDGRPERICPLVCMIHKPKHQRADPAGCSVHLSIVVMLQSSTVHMRTN